MKILHISAYAIRGGCEKDCYNLILASLEHEHEILVLGEKGPMSGDWARLGINVRHMNSLGHSLPWFRRQLVSSITEKYDQIIYWSSIRLSTVLYAVKHATQIVKVHLGNPCPYTGLQVIQESIISFFYRPIKNVHLISCSEYVASSYVGKLYFKNFRMEVSLNAVKIPQSNPKSGSLFLSPNKIGMVARLDPIKNHKLLLEAFKLVLTHLPALELHLAGKGVLMEQLVSQSVALDIQENIFFHGDVSDVYSFLSELDVFVYATTPKEGLGVSVVEAMANGLPCILPNLPMLKELDGEKGSLIWYKSTDKYELAEKIVALINDPLRMKLISNLNYQHAVLEFSPDRFVEDYLKVYD